MAHKKKKIVEQNETQQTDRIDQLISLVGGLVNEMKTMKQELDEVKNEKQLPAPTKEVIELKDEPKRETPYKVIPIEKIVRDESFVDPRLQGVKKIYMGIGRTFKNKAEAVDYLERMKKANPGMQYDIFPV